MQAGLHPGDPKVWARLLEAENARQEAPPKWSRIAAEIADQERQDQQARALAEITAAQRERDRAAWQQREDLVKRLTDLGM